MCGRTSLFAPPGVLEGTFDATLSVPYRRRYNVAPGEPLEVIADDREDAIVHQEWGLRPAGDADRSGARPINARVETIRERPLFAEAARSRRCLVLVDGFYEWQTTGRGGAQPHRVHRADDAPFALAGLWNADRRGGARHETVAVVTTEAAGPLRAIHDRMPLVLPRGAERDWLRADRAVDDDLLAADPVAALETYPVTTAVNDPGADGPAVLEPAATTQGRLEEFGG